MSLDDAQGVVKFDVFALVMAIRVRWAEQLSSAAGKVRIPF